MKYPALAPLLAAVLPLQAQVTLLDPAASALVAADAKVEKLAGGLKFTEGPVWLPDRKILVFSDIPASKLMQWSQADGVREFRASANPNGNTLDAKGRLLTCQHSARNIVRTEIDGTVSVVVDRHDGKRFNSPNDLAVKSDGTLWFTDPPYGLPKDQQKELPGNWVYRFDPASKQTTVVCKEFDMPNGIVFSPDESRLYIADSGKGQRVGAFPVKPDGTLGEPLWWAEGGSDGMRVDEKGNLYTTAADGVRIYNPDGKRLATIAIPEQPANCAFGGDDFKTLFITARTGLYRVRLHVAGHRLK
jgi:gluconolactonase